MMSILLCLLFAIVTYYYFGLVDVFPSSSVGTCVIVDFYIIATLNMNQNDRVRNSYASMKYT